MAWTDGLLIKVVNIIVFLVLLGGNVYSVAGPDDVYGSGKETYITPSYYAFYIWSLTHLLLLGAMFYQFTEKGKEFFVDKVQWRFALTALLNAVYLWFYSRHHYIIAFILSLIVSASVSTVYYTVKANHADGLAPELFIHTPFSLWHAWAIVLVCLTGMEAFGVNAHSHKAGIATKIVVFLIFVFLESTAAAYAFASQQGDIAGSAVITWALFAIYIHQTNTFVKWSAFAFFILSLLSIIKSVYTTFRSGGSLLHDEERAPLVGNSN